MKIVFVGGFFDPVLKALQEAFPSHMDAGNIVWIRQAGPGRELNINEFKSRLFGKLADGANEVLIVMAVLRGKEWAEASVRSIIENARQNYPGTAIEFRTMKNAQGSTDVLAEIATFGLPSPPEVSLVQLAEKLQGKKILSVVLDGRTGFENSLEQAGFASEAYSAHFVELKVSPGRNSNLIELLDERAKSFEHLLYAWSGLRTLPPATKKRYTQVSYEAASAFEVLLLLKRWVLNVKTDSSEQT